MIYFVTYAADCFVYVLHIFDCRFFCKFWDILVYPVTYHPTPGHPVLSHLNILPQLMFLMLEYTNINCQWHSIALPWNSILQSTYHASDILLYTGISKYMLVCAVTYNHTPPFTLNQGWSALRLWWVSAPRFSLHRFHWLPHCSLLDYNILIYPSTHTSISHDILVYHMIYLLY